MRSCLRAPRARVVILAGSLALPSLLLAQAKSGATGAGALEKEMLLLRQQVQSQQKQIENFARTLARQQQLLERLLKAEGENAALPRPHRPEDGSLSDSLNPAVIKAADTDRHALAAAVAPLSISPRRPEPSHAHLNPRVDNNEPAAVAVKIGSATLTPSGFVDATAFFRTRNLGSGIGTSFGSLPFSNTVQGHLSETRFSAQNSRFGLQYDTQFHNNVVRAYMETDFLGAHPSDAFVTSNSNGLRMRLYWVDLKHGKFEFLAGQSWSLLTPGRNGISAMPSDLFYTQNMDTNYQVGLTWARQLQFRFVYHANPHAAVALSIENPEQYVGSAVVLPSGFDPSQVSTGSSTSTPNLFPDVIGKVAFDGRVKNRQMHLELAGLLSSFRIYNGTSNRTSTTEGGGASVNASFDVTKDFRLIGTTFYSEGGGRYLGGLGPGFIVRPDLTVSPVRSEAAIGGFEFQASPHTMFFGYYGGTYFGRNYSAAPASLGGRPAYVGYGFPGSSSAVNRAIQEATFGITQTFWKNARYGALQLITQYSYLTRAPWFVAAGSPKSANLSEAYADIRYVLP